MDRLAGKSWNGLTLPLIPFVFGKLSSPYPKMLLSMGPVICDCSPVLPAVLGGTSTMCSGGTKVVCGAMDMIYQMVQL